MIHVRLNRISLNVVFEIDLYQVMYMYMSNLQYIEKIMQGFFILAGTSERGHRL